MATYDYTQRHKAQDGSYDTLLPLTRAGQVLVGTDGKRLDAELGDMDNRINDVLSDMNSLSRFKGYVETIAELEGIPNPTENCYAWVVEHIAPDTGPTVWTYTDGQWVNSHVPVPDQATPASNATPLMDGDGDAGISEEFSRGDHRHPSDTGRAPTNHASADETYGKASESTFGHVKLSDTLDHSEETTGVAVSPKAVKDSVYTKEEVYAKPEILSETTRELYGLSDAELPCTVLDALAFSAGYVWQKTIGSYTFDLGFVVARSLNASSVGTAVAITVYYADAFSIDPKTGSPVIVGDSALTTTLMIPAVVETLRGKYWVRTQDDWTNTAAIFYSPPDAAVEVVGGYLYIESQVLVITSPTKEKVPVFSPDIDAYPHDGHYAGDLYTFLGRYKDIVSLPKVQKTSPHFDRCRLSVGGQNLLDLTADRNVTAIWATPDKRKYVAYLGTNLYLLDITGRIIASIDTTQTIVNIVAIDNDFVIVYSNNNPSCLIYEFSDYGITRKMTGSIAQAFPTIFHSSFHNDEYMLILGLSSSTFYIYKYDKALNTLSSVYLWNLNSSHGPNSATLCPKGLLMFRNSNVGTSTAAYCSFYNPDTNIVSVISNLSGNHQSYAACSTDDGFYLLTFVGQIPTRTLYKYITTSGVPVLDYSVSLGALATAQTARPVALLLDGNRLYFSTTEFLDVETLEVVVLDDDDIMATFSPRITSAVTSPGSSSPYINSVFWGQAESGGNIPTATGLIFNQLRNISSEFSLKRYDFAPNSLAVFDPKIRYMTYIEEGLS